ncbi:MAG: putative lipid II flippase FtsW [Deltaproteobacteria bacterium]|nr:putative lipid II flippase FtsW [Deltaproteobacteria bacterium]
MSTRRVDPVLLWAFLLLTGIGLVMVYSASAVAAEHRTGEPLRYLLAQLGAAGIGLMAMLACIQLGSERLRHLAPLALLVAIALLCLVFLPGIGVTANGATRWVRLGVLSFQPSEVAKPAVVLYLAWTLSRKGDDKVRSLGGGFLGPGLLAGIPILLILMQPDFGTAVTLSFVVGVLLFLAGTRMRYLGLAAMMAVPAAVYLVVATPYRMRRVLAFLDPWATRDDAGYQVAESLISIGAGGVTGLGLGDGRQKLFFLPEAHTDFIFSILGEELGLLGVVAVLLLFGLIVWRGLRAAYRAETRFGAYLALGLTTLLALQAVLNMAVAMGLLPTKGLALPFLSYGGSSLVISLAMAGVLLGLSAEEGGFLRPSPGVRR